MDPKCKIEVWQFVPEDPADEPCFISYKIAGTYRLGLARTEPFICKVSCEIDGRDGEYTCIAGVPMDFAADDEDERSRWDELLEAFDHCGISADMVARDQVRKGN